MRALRPPCMAFFLRSRTDCAPARVALLYGRLQTTPFVVCFSLRPMPCLNGRTPDRPAMALTNASGPGRMTTKETLTLETLHSRSRERQPARSTHPNHLCSPTFAECGFYQAAEKGLRSRHLERNPVPGVTGRGERSAFAQALGNKSRFLKQE